MYHKHPEHPGTQRQQQRKEIPRPMSYRLRNQHRPEQHYPVQQHQGSRNAVHCQRQVNVQRRLQPLESPRELIPPGAKVVPRKQDHRQRQRNQRHKNGKVPGVPRPLPRQEHSQHRAGQRHDDGQKQGDLVEITHPFPVKPIAATR